VACAILGGRAACGLIHVNSGACACGTMGRMHYHYFTLEQRDALEAEIRARTSEPALQAALQRLHQPDYGVCVDCGRDIAFVRLQSEPDALHCGDCARLPVKP
jgi:hypothetical protein